MKKWNYLGLTAAFCSVVILAMLFFTSSFALDKFGTITADEIWSGKISVTANVTIPAGVSVTIDPILVYFDFNCLSTGPLEGTNNKIKTMQRKSYGYRDMEFFKPKIMAIHETKYALVG